MPSLLQVFIKVIFLGFVSVLIVLSLGYIYLFKSTLNTFRYDDPKLIKIHRGQNYRDIVDELHTEGVIKHKEPLLFMAKFMPETRNIKPGRYYVPSSLTTSELVLFLYKRKQDEVKVRLPDGSPAWEIAQVIGQSLDTDSATFMQAFKNEKLLKELRVDAPDFEGYLLADTYNLPWASTAEDAIRFFVGEFRKFYNDSLRQKAERAGLSEIEVLTLASIVQKETGTFAEMPLVAGVYLNRLKKGMLLQADPTFIYAAILENDYDGNPNTPRHRRRKSPYNTYLYPGLPPGPIGNPTREAILATLSPAKTNYLFFVATGYGGHRFAETAGDHAANAELYYIRRKQFNDSLRAVEKMTEKK
jgi:UPF0755 protein